MENYHIAKGKIVLLNDSVVYECESPVEAKKIAKAANDFYSKNNRQHFEFEELELVKE